MIALTASYTGYSIATWRNIIIIINGCILPNVVILTFTSFKHLLNNCS